MGMSKWVPTTDLMMLRRMGKLTEELGELQSVAARVVIQGIDEIDPGSGKVNRDRLENEMADVKAQLACTVLALGLDQGRIDRRTVEKMKQMQEWEAMFESEPSKALHTGDAHEPNQKLIQELGEIARHSIAAAEAVSRLNES